jgi:hypothetical protein
LGEKVSIDLYIGGNGGNGGGINGGIKSELK